MKPERRLMKTKRHQYNIYKSYEPKRWIIPYCAGCVFAKSERMALVLARRYWGRGLYKAYKVTLPL